MDLKELKKQVDKITLELKNKASDELSPLIESQSVLINVILEMSTGILAQNERLTATITDLQENIKELRRQLNIPITVQNHPQVMVIRSQIRQEVLESQQAESLVDRMVTVERT